MDPVRTVAIVLGLLALAKGLWGVISPKCITAWARRHVLQRDNHHMRFYGLAIAVIGGFLLYTMWSEIAWLATLTVLIAVTITAKGLFTLFFPEVPRACIRARVAIPRLAIRLLCLIAAVLGAYLLAYGFGYL